MSSRFVLEKPNKDRDQQWRICVSWLLKRQVFKKGLYWRILNLHTPLSGWEYQVNFTLLMSLLISWCPWSLQGQLPSSLFPGGRWESLVKALSQHTAIESVYTVCISLGPGLIFSATGLLVQCLGLWMGFSLVPALMFALQTGICQCKIWTLTLVLSL